MVKETKIIEKDGKKYKITLEVSKISTPILKLKYKNKKIDVYFMDKFKLNPDETFEQIKSELIKHLDNQDKILKVIYASSEVDSNDNRADNYIDGFNVYEDDNGELQIGAFTAYGQLELTNIKGFKYDVKNVRYND